MSLALVAPPSIQQKVDLAAELKKFFGFDNFRPLQNEVVSSI